MRHRCDSPLVTPMSPPLSHLWLEPSLVRAFHFPSRDFHFPYQPISPRLAPPREFPPKFRALAHKLRALPRKSRAIALNPRAHAQERCSYPRISARKMRPCAVAKKQIQLRTSPHVRAYLQQPNQRICKVKPTIGGKKLIIPKITSKQRIFHYFLSIITNRDNPQSYYQGKSWGQSPRPIIISWNKELQRIWSRFPWL